MHSAGIRPVTAKAKMTVERLHQICAKGGGEGGYSQLYSCHHQQHYHTSLLGSRCGDSRSNPHPIRYLRILSLRGARPGAIRKGPAALSIPPVPPSQAAGSWAGLRNLSWTSHFSHAAEAGEQNKGPSLKPGCGCGCCLFVPQRLSPKFPLPR